MKVKIIGAGSIGNHLAQASRRMGWEVAVVDRDPEALERMRNDIYPSRYGAWDPSIELFVSEEAPRGGFDIIMIGTPPHVRMKLALDLLKEKPKLLQLEKPLCAPFDPHLKPFLAAVKKQRAQTKVVVGYDHAVAKSINCVVEFLRRRMIGEVVTLDVEFREHWQGIFTAHPWLSGPKDTYLGYWRRGGGASFEHSHALHLFQHLAKVGGLGEWRSVSAALKLEKRGKVEYDSIAAFSLLTESGKIGRVVQDVVTKPTRKWARLQGTEGFIEWIGSGHATGDVIRYAGKEGNLGEEIFEKKRPDDFYQETLHIKDILEGKVTAKDSPLSLGSALSVLSVLETVWKNPLKVLQPIRMIQ